MQVVCAAVDLSGRYQFEETVAVGLVGDEERRPRRRVAEDGLLERGVGGFESEGVDVHSVSLFAQSARGGIHIRHVDGEVQTATATATAGGQDRLDRRHPVGHGDSERRVCEQRAVHNRDELDVAGVQSPGSVAEAEMFRIDVRRQPCGGVGLRRRSDIGDAVQEMIELRPFGSGGMHAHMRTLECKDRFA